MSDDYSHAVPTDEDPWTCESVAGLSLDQLVIRADDAYHNDAKKMCAFYSAHICRRLSGNWTSVMAVAEDFRYAHMRQILWMFVERHYRRMVLHVKDGR